MIIVYNVFTVYSVKHLTSNIPNKNKKNHIKTLLDKITKFTQNKTYYWKRKKKNKKFYEKKQNKGNEGHMVIVKFIAIRSVPLQIIL